MSLAIYPGSFDPITVGHRDVIERAARLFDKVIVAVVPNRDKTPVFSDEERVLLIRKTVRDLPNVEVLCFSGLLADLVREKKADVVVKGLRSVADFEDERLMASVNHALNPAFETMFLMSDNRYAHVCSRVVRDVGRHGGDLSAFVPKAILDEIEKRLKP